MSQRIPLHPKYGVNPAIPVCFYCGKEKNEILLLGNNYKQEAPRHAVWDHRPCDQCRDYMKQGIILIGVIGVDEAKSGDRSKPYRTGQFVVVSEAWVRRTLNDPQENGLCPRKLGPADHRPSTRRIEGGPKRKDTPRNIKGRLHCFVAKSRWR